jgi:hypothetical protein
MTVRILREKVAISRTVWVVVAIIVAALLSSTVVSHKGADVIHVYDMWLWMFTSTSYQEEDWVSIVQGAGMVALVTFVVIGISLAVGWLIAAIIGSFAAVIRKGT